MTRSNQTEEDQRYAFRMKEIFGAVEREEAEEGSSSSIDLENVKEFQRDIESGRQDVESGRAAEESSDSTTGKSNRSLWATICGLFCIISTLLGVIIYLATRSREPAERADREPIASGTISMCGIDLTGKKDEVNAKVYQAALKTAEKIGCNGKCDVVITTKPCTSSSGNNRRLLGSARGAEFFFEYLPNWDLEADVLPFLDEEGCDNEEALNDLVEAAIMVELWIYAYYGVGGWFVPYGEFDGEFGGDAVDEYYQGEIDKWVATVNCGDFCNELQNFCTETKEVIKNQLSYMERCWTKDTEEFLQAAVANDHRANTTSELRASTFTQEQLDVLDYEVYPGDGTVVGLGAEGKSLDSINCAGLCTELVDFCEEQKTMICLSETPLDSCDPYCVGFCADTDEAGGSNCICQDVCTGIFNGTASMCLSTEPEVSCQGYCASFCSRNGEGGGAEEGGGNGMDSEEHGLCVDDCEEVCQGVLAPDSGPESTSGSAE